MEGGGKSKVSLLIRFHGVEDAPYTLPNDEDELGRLADLQTCIKLFFGKNILAPIVAKPSLIGILSFSALTSVDIGTGSGLWAIQVAEEYPNTRIVGTDISPVQPTDVPPNCSFQIESLLEGFSFDTGSVDLLHSRHYPNKLTSKIGAYLEEYRRQIGQSTWLKYFESLSPEQGGQPSSKEILVFTVKTIHWIRTLRCQKYHSQ